MIPARIVADENIPRVREAFAPFGEVVLLPGRSLGPADVAEADVLLVRSVTRVDRRLLAGSRVRWVGSATIGTDHLDTEWLDAAGIAYASAPGSNAESVCDYVLSALAVAGDCLEQLLAGRCRAAVVGTGNVGGRLLRRLARLGVDVIGCDPPLAAASATQGSVALDDARSLPLRPLAEALAREVVLVHTPLTRDGRWPTHHLFDTDALGCMASGSLLLNAGRGAVVDNVALGRELATGRLTAVLDVWEGEPAIDERLLEAVLIGTPHIAGYSFDGKLAGVRQLLDAYCRFKGHAIPLETPPPPVAAPRLRLDPAATDAALVRQAILGVYDVRSDSDRLQSVREGGEPMATGFDRLRRDYPTRREISTATVENWEALNVAQTQLLVALGVSRPLT